MLCVEELGLAKTSPGFVRIDRQNLATRPMVNMLALS